MFNSEKHRSRILHNVGNDQRDKIYHESYGVNDHDERQTDHHIYMDNIGAIYLEKNNKLSNSTKNIDMRCHFIHEYIEDGVVLIEFIQSRENDSDILTKNMNIMTYNAHSAKFLMNETVES